MSRRFIPPAVEALGDGPGAEAARDLMAAREAAFIDGRDEGWREGHAAGAHDGEARMQMLCQQELSALRSDFARRDSGLLVAEALQTLLRTHDADLDALEATLRTTVAASLQVLFPALLQAAAGREVAALVADTLAERAPDTLTLHAHPDTIAAVAAEDLPSDAAARMTLVPDADLEHGAARLQWAGGGMTFDPVALLDRVTAILRPCPVITEALPT
jgi:flagellar biosynthesis/type III secretory pathway protein FliH